MDFFEYTHEKIEKEPFLLLKISPCLSIGVCTDMLLNPVATPLAGVRPVWLLLCVTGHPPGVSLLSKDVVCTRSILYWSSLQDDLYFYEDGLLCLRALPIGVSRLLAGLRY